MVHQNQPNAFYNELKDIVSKIDAKEPKELILNQIDHVDRMHLKKYPKDEVLFYYAFLDAFYTRVSEGHNEEHIYLREYDTPQINLFELLIQQFPPVKYIQHAVIQAIKQVFLRIEKGILIDIGIGTGYQVVELIKMLKNDNPNLQNLTIVGIEPNVSALNTAKETIAKLSDDQLNVNFIAVQAFAQEINFDQIVGVNDLSDETLVVNASFALHHINNLNDRMMLFQKIKGINPNLFILSEPNSDHYNPDFKQRFTNCFEHFKIVFDLIDSLHLTGDQKKTLKLFFTREIEDIIANTNWIEKHSDTSQWLDLMSRYGLRPSQFHLSDHMVHDPRLRFNWRTEGYWSLDFEGQPTVSLLAME